MVGVATTIALSDVAPAWAMVIILAILPTALCYWLCPELSVRARVVASVSSGAIGAVAVMAVFRAAQSTGLGVFGVFAVSWGTAAAVLVGSLVARRRSGEPLLGRWLLWWVLVVAGLAFMQPFALAVTWLADVDALAGLAMLAAPTLGMTAWVGAVGVAYVSTRLTCGHPARAVI
jgi:hypothetical protein